MVCSQTEAGNNCWRSQLEGADGFTKRDTAVSATLQPLEKSIKPQRKSERRCTGKTKPVAMVTETRWVDVARGS